MRAVSVTKGLPPDIDTFSSRNVLVPRSKARSVLNSPWLLVVLLLTASALAAKLTTHYLAGGAPSLPNFNWSKHPNSLLVTSPLADACSTCNLSLAGWTRIGLNHNLDVVVIAVHPSGELTALRKQFAGERLWVLTDVDKATIKRFSEGDKIGGVLIHSGRILHPQLGGTPSESFFAQPAGTSGPRR